jgi:membrane protease YdiL (CAAX protease family)
MEKVNHKETTQKTESTPVKKVNEARERVAKKPAKKTSPWHILLAAFLLVIWVCAATIATQYIITYGLYFILGKELLLTPVWMTVCNALIYALALFLIIWVPVKFFKKKALSRDEIGLHDLPTWADIGLAPAGFVVYLILSVILILIFQNFPFFDINQEQELGYEMLNGGFDRIIAFLALCIIAPIAEEIIFRGWLYAKLRNLIPGKKLSLILSILVVSVLFGILHGQWNVGVNVFAMSIVLCALREVTGTIYSGILLHIIKNTVAFLMIYVFGMS